MMISKFAGILNIQRSLNSSKKKDISKKKPKLDVVNQMQMRQRSRRNSELDRSHDSSQLDISIDEIDFDGKAQNSRQAISQSSQINDVKFNGNINYSDLQEFVQDELPEFIDDIMEKVSVGLENKNCQMQVLSDIKKRIFHYFQHC